MPVASGGTFVKESGCSGLVCRFKRAVGVPDGIRTRVTAVKGRCPRPLDDGDAVGSA